MSIDWSSLEFGYTESKYRYHAYWENGEWTEGEYTTDPYLKISEASTCLHYGQQCFEGLKAYRTVSGKLQLFRPDQNAKRFQKSCERLMMPQVPVDKFIEVCKNLVRMNEEIVPPYGAGATLYLRPYMLGVGHNLGIKPSLRYLFGVFVSPVGPYFKGGIAPVAMVTSDYDRAAARGTGAAKAGGNYAAGLYPNKLAKNNGFQDCVYLDSLTRTKIEEVGAANFFGITKDGKFATPLSDSILASVTKDSLLYIAEKMLGIPVEERDCYIDEIDEFAECGACGTAVVISPIGSITHQGKKHVFYSETEVGPVVKKLYDTLIGIQFGDIEAPEGWIVEV